MNMPATLRRDAENFAAFIVENYPDAKDWIDPVEKAAWYISHGFVAAVCDDKGEIVAYACRATCGPSRDRGAAVLFQRARNVICTWICGVDVSGDDRARLSLKDVCLSCAFRNAQRSRCSGISRSDLRIYDIQKFWKSFEKIKRVKRKKKEKQHELVEH